MSIVPATAVPRGGSTSTSSPRPSLDQSGTCAGAATRAGPRLAAILRSGLRWYIPGPVPARSFRRRP